MSTALAEVTVSNTAEQIHLFNLPPGSEATEVQLKLPKKLRYDEWEQVTDGLIKAESSSQWLIGDSLLYGRERFGEQYAQVIDVQKLKRTDEATIRGYLWVSENVKPDNRRVGLRWYHHKEVAKFDPEIQAAWLERAETLKWTVRELRQHIRELEDDANETVLEEAEIDVLQEPEVRAFITNLQGLLKAERSNVPAGVPSVLNMIDAQIGQAQWQLDRTPNEEAARVLEAIDEGWQVGSEIFNWLQKRSYFMREPELQTRLIWMCDNRKLREVKQGGKKDNQRGDLTSMYVRHDARTGDAFTVHKGTSLYESGENE